MKYLKNIEIARIFGINPTTVTNYIEAAKAGKNNLQLAEISGRSFIIDNNHNRTVIENLSDKGRKHKSKILLSRRRPDKRLYEIFQAKEIIELIDALEMEREIPTKFTYFDKGSALWDKMVDGSYAKFSNIDKVLVQSSMSYLQSRLVGVDKVNLIEMGVGNGKSVMPFLELLDGLGKLDKYIGVDISKEMIQICLNKLTKHYPNLQTASYVMDFEKESLSHILIEAQSGNHKKALNVIVCVGRTVGNTKNIDQTLRNFRSGLNKNDLIIITDAMDSEKLRISLDTFLEDESFMLNTWIPELLGIEATSQTVTTYYDSDSSSRKMVVVLDKDYEIDFELFGVTKCVKLYKGEHILIRRHRAFKLEDLGNKFEKLGLKLGYLESHPMRSDTILISEVEKVQLGN